jgi:hypothetical protein
VVAAAQERDVQAQRAQGAQLASKFLGHLTIPAVHGQGVAAGQDGGQIVGQPPVRGRLRFGGLGRQLAGLGRKVPLQAPFGETAGPPFTEVLLADGAAGKLPGEHGLDGWQGVEPGEERATRLAVLQTAVQLIPDDRGQTSDFSVTSHRAVIWGGGS